jgi:hypothetical protein
MALNIGFSSCQSRTCAVVGVARGRLRFQLLLPARRQPIKYSATIVFARSLSSLNPAAAQGNAAVPAAPPREICCKRSETAQPCIGAASGCAWQVSC